MVSNFTANDLVQNYQKPIVLITPIPIPLPTISAKNRFMFQKHWTGNKTYMKALLLSLKI